MKNFFLSRRFSTVDLIGSIVGAFATVKIGFLEGIFLDCIISLAGFYVERILNEDGQS